MSRPCGIIDRLAVIEDVSNALKVILNELGVDLVLQEDFFEKREQVQDRVGEQKVEVDVHRGHGHETGRGIEFEEIDVLTDGLMNVGRGIGGFEKI